MCNLQLFSTNLFYVVLFINIIAIGFGNLLLCLLGLNSTRHLSKNCFLFLLLGLHIAAISKHPFLFPKLKDIWLCTLFHGYLFLHTIGTMCASRRPSRVFLLIRLQTCRLIRNSDLACIDELLHRFLLVKVWEVFLVYVRLFDVKKKVLGEKFF